MNFGAAAAAAVNCTWPLSSTTFPLLCGLQSDFYLVLINVPRFASIVVFQAVQL